MTSTRAPGRPDDPPGTTAEAAVVDPRGEAPAPPREGADGARERPPRRRISIRTFESVRAVPAFRWYMLASVGSFGAMNMQMLVRGYLVFDLTGSYAALGTVMLANALPGLVLTMFGGVIADAYPKKLVVQAGQSASALLALAMGVVIALGMLRVEHLVASAAIHGAIFALMMPSRQSWLPEVVGMDRLMNAVALNSSVMTSTRLVGPLAGSLMLAAFGAEIVYFVMAGLFLFSVVTLSRVRSAYRVSERGGASRRAGGWRALVVGFAYIRDHPAIRMVLLVNLVTVMLSMSYFQMLPGWVADVLDGDVTDLGLLQTIGATGALAGALVVASLPSRRRGILYLAGSLTMGVMLIGFALSTAFWLTGVVMIALNVGSTIRMSLSNVLVQSYVEEEFRGRVMSVYMMQMSVVSLGAFVVGVLAEIAGAQQTMLGVALALTAVSLLLLAFAGGMRRLD